MPTYRLKFRKGGSDQLIEATAFAELEGSYVFFEGDETVVARVPTDVVQLVVAEKADASSN